MTFTSYSTSVFYVVLAQQEEQCGIDEKEKRDARGEKAGDRVVNVEVIEFRCRDGVDRTRRDGEDEDRAEEDGIADEGIADCHHECGQDEEAQGEEVEGIRCIAPRTPLCAVHPRPLRPALPHPARLYDGDLLSVRQ